MQWMVPKNKLGQDQEFIVNQCMTSNQSCDWIQGFAGSGKSIILVCLLEEMLIHQPTKSICLVTFTHALTDLISSGLSDKAKKIPILTIDKFIRNASRYNIVLVDEVQDLTPEKLNSIKSLCDRLIIAGDSNQSIYSGGANSHDVERLLNPKTHKLIVLYRLTQTLQRMASAILPSSPIAGATGRYQTDTDVVLAQADSSSEEAEWVVDKAMILAKSGNPSLIILPRHDDIIEFMEAIASIKGVSPPKKHYIKNKYGKSDKLDYDAINNELKNKGLPVRYLGNSFGSLEESDQMPLTFIMTYHSAKGLDFKHVFLPRMNSTVRLWRDDDELERRLFFVGITRSRENLFITYSSTTPHRLVQELPKQYMQLQSCKKIKVTIDNVITFGASF